MELDARNGILIAARCIARANAIAYHHHYYSRLIIIRSAGREFREYLVRGIYDI